MRTPRRTASPPRQLSRSLAKICLFYSEVIAVVIGPKALHPARLLVLREADHGEGVQLKELRKIVRCNASTLSRIVAFLVRKGWAQVERDSRDRRIRLVSTTANGRALIREADERIEAEMIRRMPYSAYKTERWKEAIGAADRLNDALQEWIL